MTRLSVLTAATLGVAVALFSPLTALAQSNNAPPKPEDVTIKSWLSAPNGPTVELKATWYGSNKGKEAPPVILLHDYKGSRAEYAEFAVKLQAAGYAALALDLRGHGASTVVTGVTRPLTAADLRSAQHFAAMADFDLEAVKGWLMEKNNAGQCNIERLAVVSAGMSTVVAVNWAARDWAWPTLATGQKQGQDVKALTLLSPVTNYKGYTMNQALATPALRTAISIQIAVGKEDAKAYREATRLHSQFDRFRENYENDREKFEKFQNLFLHAPDTAFQGVKLLDPRVGLEPAVMAFFKLRLLNQDLPWQQRTNPFGS